MTEPLKTFKEYLELSSDEAYYCTEHGKVDEWISFTDVLYPGVHRYCGKCFQGFLELNVRKLTAKKEKNDAVQA